MTTIAIRYRRRAHDLRLLALLHLLQRFRPARHNAVQRELGGLTAFDGAVEDGTVDQLALVVDLDHVVRGRACAGACGDRSDHNSGRGLGRALLLRDIVRELLALLLRLIGSGGGRFWASSFTFGP